MNTWGDIAAIAEEVVASYAGHRRYAGAQSGGMLRLQTDAQAAIGESATGEYYPVLAGMPKVAPGDEVAVFYLGKLPFVMGKIQRDEPTELTYEWPMVFEEEVTFEKGSNSPFISQVSQNSADVSSTTDTANYSTILTTNLVLPTGTWTVRVIAIGFLSHSSAAGVVRLQATVGGVAGTSLSGGMPLSATRGCLAAQCVRTGQSGTVAVAAEYRPNTTGTASSGGGILWILCQRTA